MVGIVGSGATGWFIYRKRVPQNGRSGDAEPGGATENIKWLKINLDYLSRIWNEWACPKSTRNGSTRRVFTGDYATDWRHPRPAAWPRRVRHHNRENLDVFYYQILIYSCSRIQFLPFFDMMCILLELFGFVVIFLVRCADLYYDILLYSTGNLSV